MKRAEQTSARVAKIAGKVLAAKLTRGYTYAIHASPATYCEITASEITALATSVLSQTPDKPYRLKVGDKITGAKSGATATVMGWADRPAPPRKKRVVEIPPPKKRRAKNHVWTARSWRHAAYLKRRRSVVKK